MAAAMITDRGLRKKLTQEAIPVKTPKKPSKRKSAASSSKSDKKNEQNNNKRPKIHTGDPKLDLFSTYQPWVIQTYGDLAKTKTITLKSMPVFCVHSAGRSATVLTVRSSVFGWRRRVSTWGSLWDTKRGPRTGSCVGTAWPTQRGARGAQRARRSIRAPRTTRRSIYRRPFEGKLLFEFKGSCMVFVDTPAVVWVVRFRKNVLIKNGIVS